MSQTAKRLARANLILDNACKQAGLDPVAIRIAMINTIKDKIEQQANGSGYSRQGANSEPIDDGAAVCHPSGEWESMGR